MRDDSVPRCDYTFPSALIKMIEFMFFRVLFENF